MRFDKPVLIVDHNVSLLNQPVQKFPETSQGATIETRQRYKEH
jgi:hypothetical protein